MRRKPLKQKKSPQITQIFTKEVLIVVGLLLLAFIFRLIYLSHLQSNDPAFYEPAPGTDMLTYHNYAKAIIDGTFGKEPYYYSPLYFYFLALIYKIFGPDPYIARLIQMILGVATSLLIYLIAKKVFNKPVALISLIISIFYGMFYIHEGVLLMEFLTTFLNTLSVFLLLRIEDNLSYKNIAFAGMAIGLSALTRANILLFIPFILVWMLFNSKFKIQNSKLLKRFTFLCLITLITISPATIRNYLVSGKFVLISTNGPINFWIGNNPYASGEFTYPPSFYGDKIADRVKKEGDKAYLKEVLTFIKEEPIGYLNLLFRKFLFFWDRYEIANNINYLSFANYSSLLKFPLILSFGNIVPFALAGVFLSLKICLRKTFLLHLFILSFMLALISFFVLGRYRIAFLPSLTIFAGFFVHYCYERMVRKEYKTVLLPLIVLIFSSSLVYSQVFLGKLYPLIHPEGFHIKTKEALVIRDDSGMNWYGNKLFALHSPSDTAKKEFIIKEDISNYKKVFLFFWYSNNGGTLIANVNGKIDIPITLKPATNLARTCYTLLPSKLFYRGVNTIALKSLSKESKADLLIDDSYSFGRSYFLNKDKWERLSKGECNIKLIFLKEPMSVLEHYGYGDALYRQGDLDNAIQEYEMGLKMDPQNIIAHKNLGFVYCEKGSKSEAIKEFEMALKLNPDDIQAKQNLAILRKRNE